MSIDVHIKLPQSDNSKQNYFYPFAHTMECGESMKHGAFNQICIIKVW